MAAARLQLLLQLAGLALLPPHTSSRRALQTGSGCTDSLASNFDAGAANDEGTCEYVCENEQKPSFQKVFQDLFLLYGIQYHFFEFL
eukprot:COSAG03_NODE_66_length_15090_cov_6.646455_3_plen_87_part_00